jgi:hypothetical protein
MLRSSCKPVFALPLLSFVSLALTGCTMGSFPTVPATEQAQVVSPPLQGSVFGGHAPLVGALVYVLTPNQSANYGLSNSLMDGDTQNASLTPSGTGNSAVSSGGSNGYHYATTDVTGASISPVTMPARSIRPSTLSPSAAARPFLPPATTSPHRR